MHGPPTLPGHEPPSPDAPDRLHLLIYDYVEDVVDKRGPHRAGHLQMGDDLARRGASRRWAASIGDPPHGGVLVFRVEDAAEVEAFARADPYVENGVVTSYRVEPWTVVRVAGGPADCARHRLEPGRARRARRGERAR